MTSHMKTLSSKLKHYAPLHWRQHGEALLCNSNRKDNRKMIMNISSMHISEKEDIAIVFHIDAMGVQHAHIRVFT